MRLKSPILLASIFAAVALLSAANPVSDRDDLIVADWSHPNDAFQGRLQYWQPVPEGYQERSLTRRNGERTAVFIVSGQSNSVGYGAGDLYTPRHAAKIDSYSIFSRTLYEGKEPGPNVDGPGTSWMYRMADILIARDFADRIIIVPAGMGAAPAQFFAPGGPVANFIPAACKLLKSEGLTPTAVLWQQGESESGSGVDPSTYLNDTREAIAWARSSGCEDVPWMVAKSTLISWKTSDAIRAAQTELTDDENVFAGPDTDVLAGRRYRADGTHFSEAGVNAAARLWAYAVAREFSRRI